MKVTEHDLKLIEELKFGLFAHKHEDKWIEDLWLKSYSLSLSFDKDFRKTMRRIKVENKFRWLERERKCGCYFWMWSFRKPSAYNVECDKHSFMKSLFLEDEDERT